jgi:subfamily B ATP-binding cassette protein MsbA
MRNYWRYIAYVWRYKIRVIVSVSSSLLTECLNFCSFAAFAVVVEVLLNLRQTGEPGRMASSGVFRTSIGRRLLEYLQEHASPDRVLLETLTYMAAALLALVIVRNVLDFARAYFLQAAGLRGWTDLMNTLFERITHLSMRFFSKQSLGHTMSAFGADINELRHGGQLIFTHAIRDPFRLFGGMAFAFAISLRLSLITFIALPFAFYIIKWVGDRTRHYTRKRLEKRADTMKILGETNQGATVIKAYDAEQYQIDRFQAASGRMLSYGLRQAMVKALAGPLTDATSWFCRIAVIIYGVHLILTGRLALSMLMTFAYCVKQIYETLERLRDLYSEAQQCRAAADRVFAFMDMVPEIREKPDAVPLPPLHTDIQFDHVHFSYDPPKEVLHDFHLTVRAGEVLAIVGENGSGKTTLVNLLLRFYDPTSGSIRIDGTDIRDATLRSLRRQVGYVPQHVVLFNDTVRRNIAFGDTVYSDAEIEAAARMALAHDFIVHLPGGYASVIGESGAKVSGGQRQRIALARSLLRNPRILILDEATSAMDVEAEHRLQEELELFAQGRTVFLIAHRFSALRSADRIVVMANGRIEQVGTHDELLLASPTYRRLHHKQHATPQAEHAV